MRAHLDQIERVNPKVNAIVTLLPEQALQGARAADRRLRSGERLGPAARPAGRAQGPAADQGHPHDLRLAHLPGLRAGHRCHHRRAAARRRRHHHRQDQHAGVRRRLADLQPGVRRDAQSLRSDARPAAAAAAAPRSRSPAAWCRSPTAPTWAARCAIRRASATSSACGPRPAACRPGRRVNAWYPAGGARADGAHRARTSRCMLSVHRGARSARADLDRRAGQRRSRGRSSATSAACGSPGARPGRPAGRPARDARPCEPGARRARASWAARWTTRRPISPTRTRCSASCAPTTSSFATGTLLETRRGEMKDTVVWNIEEGAQADRAAGRPRGGQAHRAVPSHAQVYGTIRVPRGAGGAGAALRRRTSRGSTEINGETMHTYLDWMKSCYYISVTGLPAISVPCGFTPEGLPVGLQIVGRHQDELRRAAARLRVPAAHPAVEAASAAGGLDP